MKRIFAIAIILFHSIVTAQVYNPVPVIGFNHDVVAEGNENSSLVTTTKEMDAISPSNFVMCTREFAEANGFLPANTYGLPDSGRFSVPGRTFQMAPFTEDNVLYLMGNETGILELLTPSRFTDFSLLALATEGNAEVTIRFQFADGSTLTFNKTIDDWFNATVPQTFSGYGRVKRKNGPILTGDYEAAPNNPRFRNLDFVLPCNKTLVAIEVSNTAFAGSASNRAFILAAAGLERKAKPSVSIATADSLACIGDTVKLLATPDTGGTAPGYHWFVNGQPKGTNSAIFSSDSLKNGDQVLCTMKSNFPCAFPDSVASNLFVVSLKPRLIPKAKLFIPDSLICEGKSLLVKVVTENCGDSPVFRWFLDGDNFGGGPLEKLFKNYSSGTPIWCEVKTNGKCLSLPFVYSDTAKLETQPVYKISAIWDVPVLLEDAPFKIRSTPSFTVWNGPGISAGNIFSPREAGAGKHVLTASIPGNECSNTFTDTIKVLDIEPTNLVLGSGEKEINKFWTIKRPELKTGEKASVEVYNRWGKLVRNFENYQNDWAAAELGAGCYYYKITYSIPGRNKPILKTGYFTFVP